ncbi:CGNR zinc finger domain-containing protein [Cryptosporangium minutisporangium]|uniref:CGNR zinc finger domain-containing protein n=1 Tax=Cryptosporangium minutisporangium TaxID=113569 RepID=A0ABP6SY03_9ACTN
MAPSDIRMVGGHLALDLVNTVEPRVPGATDFREHLRTPDDLLDWGQRAGLLDAREAVAVRGAWASSPATGDQAVRATHEVREATYGALLAVLGLAADATPQLDALSLRWAAATTRSALVLGGPREPVRLDVGTTPAMLVQDRLATAAVDLLRTVDTRQLRACPLEKGGCGWLFLDQSRNRSRRWCAMEDCGTHAKARRLTARRRVAHATS